jgi:hypothetical protein
MRLAFHRLIASDISTIMTYYEDVGGPKLAEESPTHSWNRSTLIGSSHFTPSHERASYIANVSLLRYSHKQLLLVQSAPHHLQLGGR